MKTNQDALQIAQDLLLKPASLDELAIQKVIHSMIGRHIDDADLYFQMSHDESWYLEESQVKSGSFSIDKGVGIRAVSGDKTGYAYCYDVLLPSLQRAADAARSIAFSSIKTAQSRVSTATPMMRYDALNPIDTLSKGEKIALLEAIDSEARRLDSRVVQVNASLSGCYDVVMMVDIKGEMRADVRPLVSVNVSVIVEDKKGR